MFGDTEEMSHIYYCVRLNGNRNVKRNDEDSYENDTMKQIEILKIFQKI